MTTSNTAFVPPDNVQENLLGVHRKISLNNSRISAIREHMRSIDLAYLREEDITPDNLRARLANRRGDANKVQNITIPVVKPQISSAVDYQLSVFLTDYPIFGVVSAPAYINEAMQLQALIEENSIRMGWVHEFTKFFFDSMKYWGVIEPVWDKVVTAAIETDLNFKAGQEGKPKEVVWQGNRITRWDPYNTYFDTTCDMHAISTEGEFAGHTQLMTKTALLTFLYRLDNRIKQNITKAINSSSANSFTAAETPYANSYFVPTLNMSSALFRQGLADASWTTYLGLANGEARRGMYEVSTEYVRIIPKDVDLKVPERGTPQIWKFIWVNHSVLVYAERQTNAHERIPTLFFQPSEEGLRLQSKTYAEDAIPFQQTASALMNSVLASRRRAVSDRLIYDPSRILEAHINNPNPAARIPVRPSAYGSDISQSVYQLPFRDDQAAIALQEIQQVVQFGNILNGQNPVRQGQFVKGNKTDGQWQDSMAAATSKDQRTALLAEAIVFTPLKEIIKLNYLQYQGAASIYSPSKDKAISIDPVQLRLASLSFKVTDGLVAKDKVMSGDALKVGMQVITSSPAIGSAYNIGPMFSYMMKMANADFAPFEKSPQQQAYEQALGTWNQVAMAAAEKGTQISTPMPTPQQYGYDPQNSIPSPNQGAQQ